MQISGTYHARARTFNAKMHFKNLNEKQSGIKVTVVIIGRENKIVYNLTTYKAHIHKPAGFKVKCWFL